MRLLGTLVVAGLVTKASRGLGYQVTSIVAGSLAPIIAVKLLDIYGSSVPIAVYLAVACAITVVAVVVARETKGLALESIERRAM